MVTIKLKHTTASQLFKQLSSYAKHHPLYKAIKEFGRIIKSIFILTYIDDDELRQHIEQQLNRVVLSNKFSKAVFFDKSHEFQTGYQADMEIITACKVLIQNAIVLWNYLYLSQMLVNINSLQVRSTLLDAIRSSSMMAWSHINMQGEYDFTKIASNETYFDMKEILAVRLDFEATRGATK